MQEPLSRRALFFARLLSAEVFRIHSGGALFQYTAVLVRPVAGEHQRSEPARRLYDWLQSPAFANLLRPHGGPGAGFQVPPFHLQPK